MNAVLTTLLSLLAQIAPAVSAQTGTVSSILNALIQIIPLIVKEAQDLAPMVKNIIAVLQADPNTTAAELAQLDTLNAQVDTAFDDAAKAASDQDAAGA